MPDFFENDSKSRLEKEVSERKSHTLWCEKYRPLNLKSFIGNELVKNKATQYIQENDLPHILLFGSAGGGKTTLAHIITKNINCDAMYINASDENSVDTVRDKIQGFASSLGFRDLKVIILDEADMLTFQAQAAMRNLMETFSTHTRFILTCNYVEKIITPIRSRCQEFELRPPSMADVATHTAYILKSEKVKYELSDVATIVKSMYPDIRRIINTAQLQTHKGVLEINQKALIDADYKLKILEILKDKDLDKKAAFRAIRQIVADNSISTFTDMYKLLYDELDTIADGHIAASILILSEAQYKESFVVDKEIAFMSMIINLISELKTKA